MKFIGITGGVGAGKSAVLQYLSEKENTRVMLADEIAHDLMKRETRCYHKIIRTFRNEHLLDTNGEFNREQLAKIIFSSAENRLKMNSIVHPAVKEYVKQQFEFEKARGALDFLVLEAALLIEEHYDEICDELWYIHAFPRIRKKRLMESRGYSSEKVEQIFASQLSEQIFREKCKVIIDNNGDLSQTFLQIEKALGDYAASESHGDRKKENVVGMEQPFVFGLDIGTRNVVGTVGYLEDEHSFIIQAQCAMEHETRAMIDGQIHDIGRVARTIKKVKEKLEDQIKQPLTEVCIAAAGRVLKTVTVSVEYEYPEESVVTSGDVHTLDLLGIEKAQQILKDENDTQYKFYCVGYTVVKYYLNGEPFSNLEDHKAERISEDIIVTFLPEDVVDGLYSAVGQAGLEVASMTLEPIAAINIAIPETFRMLNIALVDIGAGTSDISVTKGGSVAAYGMIPLAGDELTDLIVQEYLVDFKTAEAIKLASTEGGEITYRDIMLLEHKVSSEEIWKLLEPSVERMTTAVAAKIKELNGDKSVSAAFIVGGGGKIHGYTESLAEKLGILKERVALRGEEVLQEVTFLQPDIKKDPLLVTPIGICMNYYRQKNNFIMVRLNGERVKLYNNNRLTIVDAALQAGLSNEDLFPKRGKEIHYTINGIDKVERGRAGESAVITMNGKPAGMNTRLEANSEIEIERSTQGADAVLRIEKLEEYKGQQLNFIVNGSRITCPKCVEVNGELKPGAYEIQDGDVVEIRGYYTVEQIAEFMDVEVDMTEDVFVNNRSVDMDTPVYDNFTLEWVTLSYAAADGKEDAHTEDEDYEKAAEIQNADTQKAAIHSIQVHVNRQPVVLSGKSEYVFVDVFDYYDFDLQAGGGRGIITKLNGEIAQYTAVLKDGDRIELAWKEN